MSACLLLGTPGSNWCFSFAPELVSNSAPRISIVRQFTQSVSPRVGFIGVFIMVSMFLLDDSLAS